MDSYKYHEASTADVTNQALIPLFLALAFVPAAFFLPELDPTRAPYADLNPGYSQAALLLSDSANIFGVTLIGLVLVLIMATRPRMTPHYRLKEALALAAFAILFAGGGSWINEHQVKEAVKEPRPNIEWLASESGNGMLAMSASDFYGLGDKSARHDYLSGVLSEVSLPITEKVKAHWLDETGYSLPSGHSFSAFFFASFFLAFACTFVATRRRWWFYLLLPWAVMVCYSRLILRVHTPTDITLGAGMGVAFGLTAWWISRAIIRRLAQSEVSG